MRASGPFMQCCTKISSRQSAVLGRRMVPACSASTNEWKKLGVAKLASAQRTLATATAVHKTESETAGREQPEETRSTRPKDQRLLSGSQWLKENTPNLCIVFPGEVEQLDESAYQHSQGTVVLGWNERDGMGPRGAVAVEILYATFPGGPPGVVLVGSPVLSPNQRHFTRRLSVDAYSPDGDPNIFQPDVLLASLEPCCPCNHSDRQRSISRSTD